jgi:cytochrome o ubiquinol oxidase subunit 3
MHKEVSKEKVFLGFWIYMMTDLLMFSVLFAVYIVLKDSTFGSITISGIYDPPFVLTETIVLLISSFTVGLAILYAIKKLRTQTILFLILTAILGLIFLGMELYEFSHLFSEGYTFQDSAFLSAFFTLLSFHGLHIIGGTIWITILATHVYFKGVVDNNIRKLKMMGIFWHFLDVVWIFIFTIVYLFGVVI